jgi:anti-sigma factor ChrR (cupin superfamily)
VTLDAKLVLALAPKVLAQAREFVPFRSGVEIARLYNEGRGGASAALLRYAAGASVPLHRHLGHEHVLVIEGAQQDERGLYETGTFVINPPGSEHSVFSPSGCLVLIVWQRPVVFLTDRRGAAPDEPSTRLERHSSFRGKEPADTPASHLRHEDETPNPR